MEQTLGTPLTDEAIAVLAEKTEGWAVGLRLATLTLRYSEEIDGQIARLHAENHFVMDYLINEVQSHIPPAIQSFLLKTAILDRLCAPLCMAVIGPDRADCQPQACLEWLEQSGMFTTALDAQGQWYRYHHLFQEFLRARLMRQSGADEIAALHLRASAWFAANGFIEEALQHALAGQDTAAAVRLVAQHRHALLNDEQWPLLESLVAYVPARQSWPYPDLLLLSSLDRRRGRLDSGHVIDALDQAERLVTPDGGSAGTRPPTAGRNRYCYASRCTILATDTDALIAQTPQALESTPQEWYHGAERCMAAPGPCLPDIRSARPCLCGARHGPAGRHRGDGAVRGRVGRHVLLHPLDRRGFAGDAADGGRYPGRRPATSPESSPLVGGTIS